ncbi:MAG TPA: PAS domain S-box protein [Chthoniobacter sp.]|jgi:PAS domain S-box-containing protein
MPRSFVELRESHLARESDAGRKADEASRKVPREHDLAPEFPEKRGLLPAAMVPALLIFAGMCVYGWTEQVLFASIGSWEIHVLTVGFSAAFAAIGGWTIYRRREAIVELTGELSNQRQTETDLWELKRQHEAIFDSISEGILWVNREGRFIFGNRAAAGMLGWNISELIGRPAHGTVHHSRGDGTAYLVEECPVFDTIRTGTVRRAGGEVFWRKDGTSFPVEYTSTAVRAETGEVIGAVVVFSGITEQREAREAQERMTAALAAERQRFDEILNAVPAVVHEFLVGDETTPARRFISNHVERLYGYPREEWLAVEATWLEHVHPEDRERISAEAAEVFSGRREQVKSVCRAIAKDGRELWIETQHVAVRGASGRVIGVRGVTFDVTDRVKTHEELRWKTAFLEAQTNANLDAILVVDAERKNLLRNRQMMDIWKLPLELVERGDDMEILRYALGTTKYPEQFLARVEHLYAHPDEIGRDEIELKDGRFLDRYSSPVFGEDGTYYGRIWTFRDITERKQAEAETRELNRQLVVLSRQAGMAEVASSVLHNVGNVLNSVNTSITVAVDKVDQLKVDSLAAVVKLLEGEAEDLPRFFASHAQGRRLPKFLGQIAEHFAGDQRTIAEELKALRNNLEHINDIVAMQQSYAISGGYTEVLPLEEVIEDALRMNTAAFDRHGTGVAREFDPALPPMPVDRNKMLLILVNLIRNAKYACDEGGNADKRVTVRTEFDGGVRISVIDNGVGIRPENLARLFEHGFTTRKNGHGFGLHSSALAAREMGGSLSVRSEGPGQGAVFTIELPLPCKQP